MIEAEQVLITRNGEHVVQIRINRPDARNALTDQIRDRLASEFRAFAVDETVRCVVITGSEKVFVAGADIRAMANATVGDVVLQSRERLWQPIKDFPKPLIAAVNGWALGAGCELAMHADIIIAGESAQFGQPEIKLGIMPGAGGTQRLVRAIGKFMAMNMLLTGVSISASEARAAGLVSEVVPEHRTLDRALELANTIVALPPVAVRKIKEAVLLGADLPIDAALVFERQAFQSLFGTEDQKEGMAAFLEKRTPSFRGR